MRTCLAIGISLAASIAGPAFAAPPALSLPAGAETAAKVIDKGVLESAVRFLADDLLEGRAPSHRGDALACLYVASVMESLGLTPGGPRGGWWARPPGRAGCATRWTGWRKRPRRDVRCPSPDARTATCRPGRVASRSRAAFIESGPAL